MRYAPYKEKIYFLLLKDYFLKHIFTVKNILKILNFKYIMGLFRIFHLQKKYVYTCTYFIHQNFF